MGELFASFRSTLPKAKREYVTTKWGALLPFWATVDVSTVTPKKLREYYAWRRKHRTQYGEPPTNGTLQKDRTLLGQFSAMLSKKDISLPSHHCRAPASLKSRRGPGSPTTN
jgi:hypothetical protein